MTVKDNLGKKKKNGNYKECITSFLNSLISYDPPMKEAQNIISYKGHLDVVRFPVFCQSGGDGKIGEIG